MTGGTKDWRHALRLRGGQSETPEEDGENSKPVPMADPGYGEEKGPIPGVSSIMITLNDQLKQAVFDYNVSLADRLIGLGADVNHVENGTHATALITATFQNDRAMMTMLIGRGADVNLDDQMHMTPLHYGAAWGYWQACDILLTAGADPTIENLERVTAAQIARDRGHNTTAENIEKWIESR